MHKTTEVADFAVFHAPTFNCANLAHLKARRNHCNISSQWWVSVLFDGFVAQQPHTPPTRKRANECEMVWNGSRQSKWQIELNLICTPSISHDNIGARCTVHSLGFTVFDEKSSSAIWILSISMRLVVDVNATLIYRRRDVDTIDENSHSNHTVSHRCDCRLRTGTAKKWSKYSHLRFSISSSLFTHNLLLSYVRACTASKRRA